MSDEEVMSEEEHDVEHATPPPEDEVAEEPEEPEPEPSPEPVPEPEAPKPVESSGGDKTEAELAMAAAKKKHEEEELVKLKEYEEQRRLAREKEEEELRQLKEKQERRRKEREEEEAQLAERKRQEEERRKAEEEERKARIEADKQKKEAEKAKRQQMMAGQFGTGQPGQPNYQVAKKDKTQEKFDKFGNIVKAKAEMGLTKEQVEEQKRKFLAEHLKALSLEGMDVAAIKAKVKELHQRICKLEAEKYDLEKRHERQEYDLKELNERQRQINRNKALKKGLDPDAANSRFPPKVPVASKYDRQTDRRSYNERRNLFEGNKKAIPLFPNCPPPAEDLPREIAPPEREEGDDGDEPEEEGDPRGKPKPALYHGSSRPPSDWGRRDNEELDFIRKNLEPFKYIEQAPDENAMPPMAPIPVHIDEEGPEDEEGGDEGGEAVEAGEEE